MASVRWWADWLRYGESRPDWQDRFSQALEESRYEEETLRNLKYVAENVAPSRRRDDVPFAHHAEVAKLSPREQTAWLTKAADEGLSKRDLRVAIRGASRVTVAEEQAALVGNYHVIYADPPWAYRDDGAIDSGDNYGRAERHYPTMTVAEIAELPVAAHSRPDAVLFLWVPAPLLAECWPVLVAWQFTYKTQIVWDKVAHNFGHYVSVRHENLLIATRGSGTPDRLTPMLGSVQTFRRTAVHSQKPEEFRKLIERLYDPPYLELFARRRVDLPGWTFHGNQVGALIR